MKELLTMEKVSLTYHTTDGETLAVRDLNFSVREGEFVAVIGPSGCGKTTVLGLIAGLLTPSCGKVSYRGERVSECADRLGYMLQRDELFPWRTIEKNVLLPLEIKRKKTRENVDYAMGLLDKYGLGEFKKHYPDQLSGGMRQRVALIRTLAAKPELLLLDEPFSALDYQTRLTVCEDVFKIIRREKKTTVLVTHDISEAVSVADRIILLSPRPASVKEIYELGYDKELTPLKRREQRNFRDWFEILWRDLNDEAQK